MGVEARADERQIRVELLQDGAEDAVEGREVDALVRAMGQGHVHVEARAFAGSDLVGSPRSRIERILVEGDVEDAGIGEEDLLRSVAVVDVPIDDDHALGPVGAGMGRGHGGVVHQAEAHGAVRPGVVARRANERQAIAGLAAEEAVDEGQAATRRPPRRLDRALGVERVGVEVP
ncbi:MAG: hypothetical protein U0263_31615 [Polyangiaceae bacterium]